MKLNYDCIRDVLLYLEENLRLDENLSFQTISFDKLYPAESLASYSREDIFYTLYNLDEVGFIDAEIQYGNDGPYYAYVENITYAGHEFLSVIRPKKVWDKTKSFLSQIGTASIPIILEYASKSLPFNF